MKKTALFFSIFLVPTLLFSESVSLENLLTVEGLDENPLMGYGLVVGLDGSGDSADGSQTTEFVSRLSESFGFSVDTEGWQLDNSAVVLVSGTLLPSASTGSRFNITVSSVFDATSLEGGRLVLAPLYGGDGEIYAIAQGDIEIDEDSPLNGDIALGGLVQKEVDHEIETDGSLTFKISDSISLSALSSIKSAILTAYPNSDVTLDNYKMTVALPENTDAFDFISGIYGLAAEIDDEPSVLIDSDSGIVIAGGDVMISTAAISLPGMDISVGNLWGSAGSDSDLFTLYPSTTTVSELVSGMNEVGASTDQIIEVLQLLYDNGNLKAKLTVQ